MKHLGDITKISGHIAPVVDVVVGGSPCQDLSIAGKRAGLDGERSGLFMEQIRIIKEMRNEDERNGRAGVDIRPRYMVWENVIGSFSSNRGEDFRIVLEETAKVADKNAVIPRPADGKWKTCGCIMADGWSIAWRVFDAQFWGVPQRRRRIALVADFGGQSAPEILFVRKSVSGDSEQGKSKRKETASDVARSLGSTDCFGFDCYNSELTEDKQSTLGVNCGMSTGRNVVLCIDQGGGKSQANVQDDLSPTLSCTHGGEPAVCYEKNLRYIVRRLTPLECERLQGYPDGWTDIGEWTDTKGKKRKTADAPRYKALGNSIALPSWKWLLKRLCSCYERDVTMASLFDGIGGFPLIMEHLNGKGTCLWASEIEEFPIAVTKARIGGNDGYKGSF